MNGSFLLFFPAITRAIRKLLMRKSVYLVFMAHEWPNLKESEKYTIAWAEERERNWRDTDSGAKREGTKLRISFRIVIT